VRTSFLIETPGLFSELTADREGGEHDGQVGFDGVPLMVEHGPSPEVGLVQRRPATLPISAPHQTPAPLRPAQTPDGARSPVQLR